MIEWEATVVVVARVAVGAVLFAAGWVKLRRGSRMFRDAVLAYDLVPRRVAPLLAVVIPALESFCGIGLILGVATPASAIVGFALIGIVTGAVIVSLARGKRHFCGCMGFSGDDVRVIQWSIAYRNLALMGVLLLIVSCRDDYRLDRVLGLANFAASDAWLPLLGPAWAISIAVVLITRLIGRPPSATHEATSAGRPLPDGSA